LAPCSVICADETVLLVIFRKQGIDHSFNFNPVEVVKALYHRIESVRILGEPLLLTHSLPFLVNLQASPVMFVVHIVQVKYAIMLHMALPLVLISSLL